jgi:hypothetical protein
MMEDLLDDPPELCLSFLYSLRAWNLHSNLWGGRPGGGSWEGSAPCAPQQAVQHCRVLHLIEGNQNAGEGGHLPSEVEPVAGSECG